MISRLTTAFRTIFLAGLAVLIPLVATFWILRTLMLWAEAFFLGLLPVAWQPQTLVGIRLPGIGLLAVLCLILLTGFITRIYVARLVIGWGEAVLRRIPVARGIYHGVKQLMQFIVGDQRHRYSRVVLVPMFGVASRAYGFVTGESRVLQRDGTVTMMLHVFLPTTPNPTSGFLILIPEADTVPTALTVEQASRLIVSGGLV